MPVEVDLRRCERIHPPAALWCMIYMLLVADRGVDCEVRLPFSPERSRVTITPDDLGLLNLVRIMGELEEFVLPVTRFNSISEVEALENSIIDDLERRNLGAPNVYIDVSVAFAELANNAVEHAQSPIDAYGYVCISNNNTVVVSVADGGIGIKASLQQNPEHAVCGLTDWDAIEYAIQENISGTLDRTRGIGLHHIAYDIVPPDRSMGIYSGTGLVTVNGKV